MAGPAGHADASIIVSFSGSLPPLPWDRAPMRTSDWLSLSFVLLCERAVEQRGRAQVEGPMPSNPGSAVQPWLT